MSERLNLVFYFSDMNASIFEIYYKPVKNEDYRIYFYSINLFYDI